MPRVGSLAQESNLCMTQAQPKKKKKKKKKNSQPGEARGKCLSQRTAYAKALGQEELPEKTSMYIVSQEQMEPEKAGDADKVRLPKDL